MNALATHRFVASIHERNANTGYLINIGESINSIFRHLCTSHVNKSPQIDIKLVPFTRFLRLLILRRSLPSRTDKANAFRLCYESKINIELRKQIHTLVKYSDKSDFDFDFW